MNRVIMLLPGPDNLQLANCHKYVTRRDDKVYSDVYTMTTIVGQCANTDKILVIGHGNKGGFHGATVDQVVTAIIDSGISLTGNKKLAFDTCYAGYSDTNVTSALHQVRDKLKKHNPACNLELVGATGCSITIGSIGYSTTLPFIGGIDLSGLGGKTDKRLVVKEARLTQAGNLQKEMSQNYGADLAGHRTDWQEGAPSSKIKTWAQAEYSKLIGFAIAFRSNLGPDLETGAGRKVKIQV